MGNLKNAIRTHIYFHLFSISQSWSNASTVGEGIPTCPAAGHLQVLGTDRECEKVSPTVPKAPEERKALAVNLVPMSPTNTNSVSAPYLPSTRRRLCLALYNKYYICQDSFKWPVI